MKNTSEKQPNEKIFRPGRVYYYTRALSPEELREILEFDWKGWRREVIDYLIREKENVPTPSNELSRVLQLAGEGNSVQFRYGSYANRINTDLRNRRMPYALARAEANPEERRYRFFRRKE